MMGTPSFLPPVVHEGGLQAMVVNEIAARDRLSRGHEGGHKQQQRRCAHDTHRFSLNSTTTLLSDQTKQNTVRNEHEHNTVGLKIVTLVGSNVGATSRHLAVD